MDKLTHIRVGDEIGYYGYGKEKLIGKVLEVQETDLQMHRRKEGERQQ